ncbi:aminotransferase class III-fold pyridoxal phosphate-dependent enzyme [Lacisediminimonas profundi]|uniref:aminotransferase class III-fold pyridoxal phosphate-dependent enzyme n=1 Tax=Lacisediminimonas profundi TaxID=2603856 RepID=UPI00124B2DFB|nr:aminotransferase class III-fold pyridoxal phosphate-dependent enzyme [Lacisediminimonas profundi]
MKVVAIVQARMGSTRLPNKVMKPIAGVPMIELLLDRLSRSRELAQIVLATSVDPRNQPLVDHVRELGYACEQGSEDNVLDRFVQAARKHQADVVVRITGDCPLTDPELVDECIRRFRTSEVDYFTNTSPPTFPDGLDIEVVSVKALEQALLESDKSSDLEHVTPYVRESGKFRTGNMENDKDFSSLRWTVDEQADFDVVNAVFRHFSPDDHFGWREVLALHQSQPQLFAANQQLIRNEGALLGTGQKLWKHAKQIIPGGNMLLSKRAEMFLPEQWPAYFSKAKGCKVWDMDGNEFIDMCIMGIGTNTLGYGHPEVDDAVRRTIDAGNMSTFNCPEEVYLAEKLIELHPWADMARFARSGGEANAIAIRIARAATGKDGVAVCGYHGWHDWYLSANLGDDENLAGHLLPGLEPKGVPKNLRGTVFPFNYNNFAELEALVNKHDIGVIKMEVVRNMGPEDNFLHKVRKLATERNMVLIFDECTSGFRETFGGLHKKYGVEPDMAMFGKAMGNGYAITATIGRREVMEAAQSTFISSTFWTERIGPTAALATLEVMERVKSWDTITATGLEIRRRWQELADKHGLQVDHWGLPALTGYTFRSPNALAYKTLVTQEMLAKGYLAANSVYVCTEHTPEVLDGYFQALDPLFKLIRECEDGRDVSALLKGPVCHGGFKRLN